MKQSKHSKNTRFTTRAECHCRNVLEKGGGEGGGGGGGGGGRESRSVASAFVALFLDRIVSDQLSWSR